MSCDPLFTDGFAFPRSIFNRPGLPRIAYRIGAYPDFLEAMLRRIDAAPELAAWTHRKSDDPGIALVEGAAIVGDILTFYQELYANEAYLRTAAWRESVADLVRVYGYRLSPGIGGRATFAFEVKRQVEVPAGFLVKADLEDATASAEFELDAALTAYPHLSKTRFYRARTYATAIASSVSQVELASVGGLADAATLAAFELKQGDRLMLAPDESMWSTAGTPYTAQAAPQIVTVKAVKRVLDRTIIELENRPIAPWGSPARAWRIGRTFRHFGHNAPALLSRPQLDIGGGVIGTYVVNTRFDRAVQTDPSTYGYEGDSYTSLAKLEMPLDVEATGLAPGMTILCEGGISIALSPDLSPFFVVRTVATVRATTVTWANLNGASTLLGLDRELAPNTSLSTVRSDIRTLRFHEVTSPALTLRPVAGGTWGAFASGAGALQYYGTAAEAQNLAARRLWLAHADGRALELTCTNVAADFPAAVPDLPRLWTISFDRAPTPFQHQDFNEATPTVDVYGNLGDASQGKTEREVVLGNGDARAPFQTFPLPKAPLTYFNSPAAIPPETPELEVHVAGRLWSRVDSFYGRGPLEELYIVREAADGKSYIQFGGGVTGARLPSGMKNVTAVYRTGSGARGALKAGATPSPGTRIDGLDKVQLAGIVSGGADPEDVEKTRAAAPGKVQSLGRLVSLRDFETETLGISGVTKAAAAWDLAGGVPAVILRVLLEAGREAEFADVHDTIAHYQRCRGPDRFPVVVEQAWLRYVYLDLTYARDPSFRQEDVDLAVRAALGLADDEASPRSGLFGLHARRLGECEYETRIEGRVQQVAGVLWCRVTALGALAPFATDPATLVLPAAPRALSAQLACAPAELLQLDAAHLTLVEAAAPAAGECE